MTLFAIYDDRGAILRTGRCQADCVALQAQPGEHWVVTGGTVRDDTHFISDVGFGQWAEKGTRPSERHDFDYATATWVEHHDMLGEIAKKIDEINAACRATIIGGFVSSALGTPHVYDSEETDQINLIGQRERATLTGEAQLYKCREVATGVKGWRPHTAAQLNQVFLDGAAFKESCLVAATGFKAAIAAATTLDDILVVVWVDPA